MALKEQFEAQGNWLFRRRGYLPVLVLPILLVALWRAASSQSTWGAPYQGLYVGLCFAISFAGLFIRCATIGYTPEGTSGRNTDDQLAKTLNTTGLYSIVRHPLYLGNFLIFAGLVLFVQVWWFAVITMLLFALYYERIMFAEEEFLRASFGEQFTSWARNTPAFVPSPRRWRRPDLEFSLRNVLKREYTGLLVIAASFTILQVAGDLFTEGRLTIDLAWSVFLLSAVLIYMVLRTLKKRTRVLHVRGR